LLIRPPPISTHCFWWAGSFVYKRQYKTPHPQITRPATAGLLHFFPCAFSFFDKSGKLFLLINKKYSSRNTATLPWKVAAVFRRTVNKPATTHLKVRIPSREIH
ncbi:hypothetical protein, partial [Pseudomonas aeruginosa]|uniref:hypothetical protein n=1 Tax=Pseudomonas aeruginosa TaxID=287 RepID=UPI0021F0F0DC